MEWTKIFTYGTLKKGFSNHKLMIELINAGEARYLGTYQTEDRFPLVCGPYRVPFLLNFPGRGRAVVGEIYEISPTSLTRIDELEGVSRGHYQRLPIRVTLVNSLDLDVDVDVIDAEAYFAHSSYADELWKKAGEVGYVVYSENEAKGYVSRNDRPPHLTFLDHISIFLSSSS
ncbi:putative gamma-glutamylcyclotransferase At3g02910 [Silene latifolia]|uniref:putative gamma-glutamylcyclotransferase At3g02910 n=1 Tax=Silene latifolia TaxID=37657 RepID=UPI003D78B242